MIHGIYIKSKPKSKWYLMSLAKNTEDAQLDCKELLRKALSEGNEKAEVAIQTFDSDFYIPEIIGNLKKTYDILN